jgi:hypothetical protein
MKFTSRSVEKHCQLSNEQGAYKSGNPCLLSAIPRSVDATTKARIRSTFLS